MFFLIFTCLLAFLFTITAAVGLSSGSSNATKDMVPRNVVYVADIWHPEPNTTSNDSHIGLLDPIENPTNITHVIMFNLNVDYTPDINTTLASVGVHSSNYNWLRSQIKTLRAAGVKVMGSSGGYGNGVFNRLNANVSRHIRRNEYTETDAYSPQFSDAYPQLLDGIKAFDFDGLDLDIELPTGPGFRFEASQLAIQ